MTEQANSNRAAMLEALLDFYPEDEASGITDDPANLGRYVLVQEHDNGRLWHASFDTIEGAMGYQEQEEFGWQAVAVFDLDTGQSANIIIKCSIDGFGKGPYTLEAKEVDDA